MPVNADDFIQLNDRIDVFRHLTVDQLTSDVNKALFEGLLNQYYHDFTAFCEQIESLDRTKIRGISCHIADEQIYFEVAYTE